MTWIFSLATYFKETSKGWTKVRNFTLVGLGLNLKAYILSLYIVWDNKIWYACPWNVVTACLIIPSKKQLTIWTTTNLCLYRFLDVLKHWSICEKCRGKEMLVIANYKCFLASLIFASTFLCFLFFSLLVLHLVFNLVQS